MALYELMITDVTCYGNLFCVAGWDIRNGGMIRPEPPNANAANEASRFWDAGSVGIGKFFAVGNVVTLHASAPPEGFPFPHATEDRLCVPAQPCAILGAHTDDQITQVVRPGVSNSLNDAFGRRLMRASSGKAFVAAGERTCSLGAIEVAPKQITFYEDNRQPGKRKLRVLVEQGGVSFDLSVPAAAARARLLTDGLDALKADIRNSGLVHVRVGLCRPFSAMPDACYAQVNGLFFL